MRNRFIVGAGNSYNVGVTGGFDSVSLSESQIPGHTHGINLTSNTDTHNHSINDSGHTHNLLYNHGAFGGSSGAVTPRSGNTPVVPGISGRVSTEGSSATNANLPPYYALAYIMKT